MTELEIGPYRLRVDEEETARQFRALLPYAGGDVGVRMFLDCLCRAPEEPMAFLASLGADPRRITVARPLAAPDEKGEVLFLAALRLCGELLSEDRAPRRSARHAGMDLVVTADHGAFTPGVPDLPEPQIELRFVLSLPFDPTFFQRI